MPPPALTTTSTAPSPRAKPARDALVAAAIATGATLLVCLPFAAGPLALFGLLLAVLAAVGAIAGVVVLLPQTLVVIVPALIPAPMVLSLFAFEAVLVFLAALLVLHGWRTRAAWLRSIGPVEVAFLAWMAWALFTGVWSEDARSWVIGARKLLAGFCTIWVGLRLSAVASRRWFDSGILTTAIVLSVLTLGRYMTTGLTPEESALRRTTVTDLGWGRANYLAAILVLCTPSLLRLLLRGRRAERWAAGITLVLVTTVQLVVASRAATALFLLGTLAYLLLAIWKYRLQVFAGFALAVTALFVSPLGEGVLSRMFNLRELGSMTIRIWFFREGWQRMLDHLPWGMGLWQGFRNADKLQGLDPHNFPLLIGGDLGIPGLVLWAWLNVTLARAWWRTRGDQASRDQAGAMLLTLVLANLNSLVEPTFQGPQFNLIFFWVLTGTLSYALRTPGFTATTSSAKP